MKRFKVQFITCIVVCGMAESCVKPEEPGSCVPCIEIEFDKSRGRVYVNILELGYLYDVLAKYDLMPNEDLTVWHGSIEKDTVKKLIEDLKEKGFDKITYLEY
jgi:hypothetical protein